MISLDKHAKCTMFIYVPATVDDTVFERGCNVDPMPVLSSILEIEL